MQPGIETECLVVGKVLKPQGLKGEIKVQPYADAPEDLTALSRLWIKDTLYEVRAARIREGFVYFYLKDVDTCEAAEKLRGQLIHAFRQELPPLPQGSHYIVDLIGCRVETDTGKLLGQVHEVLQAGGNDVYDIRGERNVLVVARKMAIVRIDIPQKLIVLFEERLPEVAVFED